MIQSVLTCFHTCAYSLCLITAVICLFFVRAVGLINSFNFEYILFQKIEFLICFEVCTLFIFAPHMHKTLSIFVSDMFSITIIQGSHDTKKDQNTGFFVGGLGILQVSCNYYF